MMNVGLLQLCGNYPAVNPTKPQVHSLSHKVDKWEVERSDLEMGPKLSLDEHGDVYKAKFKHWEKTVAVKTFKVFSLLLSVGPRLQSNR